MTDIDELEVDTTHAEAQLRQLQAHAAMTEISILQTTKNLVRVMSLTANLFGFAIPMFFSLVAEASFLAAGMYTELAKAESLTVFLAFKALLTFAVAGALFYRALRAEQARSVAEQKLNTAIQLTDALAAL